MSEFNVGVKSLAGNARATAAVQNTKTNAQKKRVRSHVPIFHLQETSSAIHFRTRKTSKRGSRPHCWIFANGSKKEADPADPEFNSANKHRAAFALSSREQKLRA
jgi:hypothetical protein